MTFFGQVAAAPTTTALRGWTYTSADGGEKAVNATYVNFMPEHVSFWIENDGPWDTLVLAEANGNVRNLREVA